MYIFKGIRKRPKIKHVKLKHVPNILSLSRIFLSMGLFFLLDHTNLFMPLYMLTGITDALDGLIARKFGLTSALGARLDSIGDFFYFIVLAIYLFHNYQGLLSPFLIAVLIVFAIRITAIITGIIKYRRLTMIHTFANKTSGFAVFLLPVFLWLSFDWFVYVVLILVVTSAIEEFLIISISKKNIDLNRRSIFFS